MNNYIAYIDIGTYSTKVLCGPLDSYSVQLVQFGGRDFCPTSACIASSGTYRFGYDADALFQKEHGAYCKYFLQKLGKKSPLLLSASGKGIVALDIMIEFQRFIKKACEQQLEMTSAILDACIAIPITFSPSQIHEQGIAAEAAGFCSISFIHDAEAIASYFNRKCQHSVANNKQLLVFDFGEESLKMSLLCRNGTGAYTLTQFRRNLFGIGASSYDAALSELIIDSLDEDSREEQFANLDQCLINRIQLRKIREYLTESDISKSVPVSCGSAVYRFSVSAKDIEMQLHDKMRWLDENIQEFLLTIPDIFSPAAVCVCGGGSLFPFLTTYVQKILPDLPYLSDSRNVFDIVVRGMNYQASRLKEATFDRVI